MNLTKTIQTEILNHAAAEAPNECCGFVIKAGRKQVYRPCKNVATEPGQRFEISPLDFIEASDQGEVIAIVHSHPNGEPFLSGADRQVQVANKLPWVLAVSGSLKIFEPVPHLRGRLFEYGAADCYTLLTDAYHLAGIDLMPVQRGDIDEDAAQELFVKLAKQAGFSRVYDVQPGDVIITAFEGHPSHALLYIGDGDVLHHAIGHLSRRDMYGRFMQDRTHSIWRHKDWQPEMLQAIKNDLEHST